MEGQYRNTILGDIVNNITGKTAADQEKARIATLNAMAEKSTTNPLIYIIPVVALLVTGVIVIVVLKKKKSRS
jgi:hypothetical protein